MTLTGSPDARPQPFVSVIVPVFDDPARLEVCLRALENQTYPKSLYQVIVVDNGSPESVECVVSRFGQARAGFEGRAGSYAARNRGLALAAGEVVAFTDADCIPSPDWIEKGVATLLGAPDCGLVAGRVDLFFADPRRPTAVELYESVAYLQQRKHVETHGFGATANLFTRRSVFERAGLFDDGMKSGGDVEWSQRVSSCGYALVYADDARVAHPARRSLGQLYRRKVRTAGGVRDLKRRKGYSRKRRAWGLLAGLAPPLRAAAEVLSDRRLKGAKEKLKVIAVLLFAHYAQAWETLRLALGGRPRR